MSQYNAQVLWMKKESEAYIDSKYSRGHTWRFDGGAIIPASSSPQIVPLPFSVEQNVDPEEAFVASLSSCHMLFFLEIAAKRGYVIQQYEDNAVGCMKKNSEGSLWMAQVVLNVAVSFSGEKQASYAQLVKMHHLSHQQCFIANSVKTQVLTEIVVVDNLTG